MTDPEKLRELFPPREHKPLTNYDLLVRKTPEEMAEFLVGRCRECRHNEKGICGNKQPAGRESITIEDYIMGPMCSDYEEFDTMEKMTYGKAITICSELNTADEELDELVVGEAIQKILSIETINTVTKDTLLNIVQYCFPLIWGEPSEEMDAKDSCLDKSGEARG